VPLFAFHYPLLTKVCPQASYPQEPEPYYPQLIHSLPKADNLEFKINNLQLKTIVHCELYILHSLDLIYWLK
jgi:hypothetical protein